MAKKTNNYQVNIRIHAEIVVSVPAQTLEEAIEIARQYNEKDLLSKNVELNDSKIRVTGVFEDYQEIKA